MDGKTLVSRQPGMIEAMADGELVGLHVERGTCYGFNATATRIWQLLTTPRTVDDLTRTLVSEHEVTEEACFAEVTELLTALGDEGLVRLEAA